MATETYDGPVCFIDGWHYSVVKKKGEDTPGVKLFSNGDGTYKLAEDGDASHFEQYHQNFATVTYEDGQASLRVNAEQFARIKAILEEEQ